MKKLIMLLNILSILMLSFYWYVDSSRSFIEIMALLVILGAISLLMIKEKKETVKKMSHINGGIEQLSKVFERVTDGIIITDTELNITMLNNSAMEALRIPPSARAAGLTLNDVFHGVVVFGKDFCELSKIVVSQKKAFSIPIIEYQNRILEDSIAPIIGNDGSSEGLIIVFSDVTERVRNETRTKELENQLAQTQKMDAIGNLSGGIAHDFNNTLTSINGYVDLIDIDLESSRMKKTREFIEKIKKNIETASALTNKLMTFSKNQIVDAKVVDINEVVNEFNDIIKNGVGEDVIVDLNLNSTRKIRADKSQIEQILLNLALNSKDAIKEKGASDGKVIVETVDAPYQYNDSNEYIILRFTDNGNGMNEEVKERLFEPFFTTKKMGQGLGLSSIYGIIRQNRGFIYVHSEKEIGTTFEIFWPSTEEQEKTKSHKIKRNKTHGGGETILCVEDNESIVDIFKRYLTQHGYNVVVANNGKEALRILENMDKVDLIITDIIMPEMGGYELIDNVKKKIPDIKVIFTSGYVDSSGKENGYCLIKKPYSLDFVLQKISKILEE